MPPSGLGGTSTHTNKTTSLCEKLRRVGEAGKSSGGREAKAKATEWVLEHGSSKFCWAINAGWAKMLIFFRMLQSGL